MKTIEDIKHLIGLDNHHTNYGDIFRRVESIIRERDTFQRLDGLVITDMDGNTVDWELSEGVVEIAHSTQPQLSEIRYVLHGDIQPCSVLYSDDTTTLLRLDEGDMMLETDTIEWSDSVTYRCQELLKSVDVRSLGHVAPRLAQLVRDERILLNDNGDDELPRPAVVIPTPPCAPATPSCGNPYVHDNFAYLEGAMRAAGWTTEDLVQNGYGHYQPVPMQRSEER